MDHSLPGSSVPGLLQARILEGVVIPYLGDLSDLGIKLGSPAWQADSLLSETQQSAKHRNLSDAEDSPQLSSLIPDFTFLCLSSNLLVQSMSLISLS